MELAQLDAFIAAGESGPRPEQSPAQPDMAATLDRARLAVGSDDTAELTAALQALIEALEAE